MNCEEENTALIRTIGLTERNESFNIKVTRTRQLDFKFVEISNEKNKVLKRKALTGPIIVACQ
jgi:hypothetical protein